MKYIYLVVVLVFAGFLLGCEMPSSQSSSAKKHITIYDCVTRSLNQRYPNYEVKTAYWKTKTFKVLEENPYRAEVLGQFDITYPFILNSGINGKTYTYSANVSTDSYDRRTIEIQINPWGFLLFPETENKISCTEN